MRNMLVAVLSLGLVIAVTSCADSQVRAKNDNRLGGQTGVAITSNNLSRIVPTRPGPVLPQN